MYIYDDFQWACSITMWQNVYELYAYAVSQEQDLSGWPTDVCVWEP